MSEATTNDERERIRRDCGQPVYWTDPARTARYYARDCLALLNDLESTERELARARAGWSEADDLG